jgi:hypothetical protein
MLGSNRDVIGINFTNATPLVDGILNLGTTDRPQTPENDYRQGGNDRRKCKLTEFELWAPQTDHRQTTET